MARYRRRVSGKFVASAVAAGIGLAVLHGHVPAGGGGATLTSANSNVALGQQIASAYGWGSGPEWTCLDELWTRESGWSSTAVNPSSGALGIAQALGHGTAGAAGTYGNEYGADYGLTTAQAQAANSGSANPQITWGLEYLSDIYGSPCGGWSHEEAAGWY